MTINQTPQPRNLVEKIIWFCLTNKVVLSLLVVFTVCWGILVAPFDWHIEGIERQPIPVDAIPDTGENQQIVFTEWMGRSPQDIEDQISYPMTTALLGIPGVKTIRSYSFFGFSSIYIIFDEDIDFYWSRSRILEKLNSLPSGTLPDGVQPALGPDATALGQVFWYTLEGHDQNGHPTGGWDLHELRTIQDWYVRYGLLAAEGVSEVASVGGFIQEYQVDVDPDAMRAHGITLNEVFKAIKMANNEVGARNIEINNVEYFIRGRGFVKSLEDLEKAVIKVNDHVPIYIKNVASVSYGPAQRRGILDKEGAETVGGVVVVRYGENPLEVIKNVKKQIETIEPGLPKKTLADGTLSQVKIVPFYDRTGLIYETLGTLNTALSHEILVTIIVILLMLMHVRSSLLISGLLPLAVLMTFIAMKLFHVDANIVALSGIAIAIGTIVDMGVVIVENILKRLDRMGESDSTLHVIYHATVEVGSAVITAVSTTVISFLPVFTMEAAEGKLFRPLAFTKTFALIASIMVAITVIPAIAHLLFQRKKQLTKKAIAIKNVFLVLAGTILAFRYPGLGILIIVLGSIKCITPFLRFDQAERWGERLINFILVFFVAFLLTAEWLPLGPSKGLGNNFLFVTLVVGLILGFFQIFRWLYPRILSWAMAHRLLFLCIPGSVVLIGGMAWLGFHAFFGWLPERVLRWTPVSKVAHAFPGLGSEFMPPLDEGSYLYMPTTSVHASIDEVKHVLSLQDKAFRQIPEVDTAVGKLGRAETPLDPAPISMIETVINYKSEFVIDSAGHYKLFQYDPDEQDWFRDIEGNPLPAPDGAPYKVQGMFLRDDQGQLIPDKDGVPFRQWRSALDPDINEGREAWAGISKPDDIWDEIIKAGKIPGTTSAPNLQPIAARIVMLQSGMRAPMGLKVFGPDLETIEQVGLQIEKLLKEVPSVQPAAVIADRIIGKPYLEFDIDREAIARYGIMQDQVQQVLMVAIGGAKITDTVEGRERFPVRVRYSRELRNSWESLQDVLVPAPGGLQIPLNQLARLEYVKGPQVIKSEDTFLTSYVIFDKKPGYAEVEVVQHADAYLKEMIANGSLVIPAGVSYKFAGNYENQLRAAAKLRIMLPLALFAIFMLLYFQFKRMGTTLLVFSGIAVAWSGGFILIWLYNQSWFLDFQMFGVNLRDLFQIQPINLSVAVWVGFLALFGIATDDGVIVATYLRQVFEKRNPNSIAGIRAATLEAGIRRVRPAIITSATTVIALIPIFTSTGRGSDIMVPMAIPTFGGMLVVQISIFVVPVLYSLFEELKVQIKMKRSPS